MDFGVIDFLEFGFEGIGFSSGSRQYQNWSQGRTTATERKFRS
jgi:hypothetical protein